MKAERRHDLKTNTLATTIVELPNFWKLHGTKVLLALVAVVAIALLVQHRVKSRAEAETKSLENLAKAQEQIRALQTPALFRLPPHDVMIQVKQLTDPANDAIAEVLNLSTDPKIRAEALVAKGDLNLLLAHLPHMPGAATQPAIQKPLSDEEYRKRAAEAYQEVLDKHLEHRPAAITAHFGLAAIDEDRANWTSAAEHYKKISDDSTAPLILRMLAQRQITDELPMLQIAPIIGTIPTQPAATLPVATPTTTPTTAPSTRPTM